MTGGPSAMTFIDPWLIAPASQGISEGQPVTLAASRCTSCERVDFPRRDNCSRCEGTVREHSLEARARVGARTSVLHAPPGALIPVPYDIAIGEFECGVALLGLLQEGTEVQRGDPVEVVSVAVGDQLTYAYRPIPRGAADGCAHDVGRGA